MLEKNLTTGDIEQVEQLLREMKEKMHTMKGERYALISSSWLAMWRESIHMPIDNSGLLDSNGNLKPGLNQQEDYEVLTLEIWNYFVNRYGGGPEVLLWSTAVGFLYHIDPYSISVICTYKGSEVKHRMSRFQTVRGTLYELGTIIFQPPDALSVSLIRENGEIVPLTTDNMNLTLQALVVKDNDRLEILDTRERESS